MSRCATAQHTTLSNQTVHAHVQYLLSTVFLVIQPLHARPITSRYIFKLNAQWIVPYVRSIFSHANHILQTRTTCHIEFYCVQDVCTDRAWDPGYSFPFQFQPRPQGLSVLPEPVTARIVYRAINANAALLRCRVFPELPSWLNQASWLP